MNKLFFIIACLSCCDALSAPLDGVSGDLFNEQDHIEKHEVLWKWFKPIIEALDIPYNVEIPEKGEGEYVSHLCGISRYDEYPIIITARVIRKKSYYVEGCCGCLPRVSYEDSDNPLWLSLAKFLDNGAGSLMLSLCCASLTVVPDLPLDALYVFRYNPDAATWKSQKFFQKARVKKALDKVEKLTLKNSKSPLIETLGCNFSIKNGFISYQEPYFWCTDHKKIAFVVPGQRKMYILKPSDSVRMDVSQKGHDCFFTFT